MLGSQRRFGRCVSRLSHGRVALLLEFTFARQFVELAIARFEIEFVVVVIAVVLERFAIAAADAPLRVHHWATAIVVEVSLLVLHLAVLVAILLLLLLLRKRTVIGEERLSHGQVVFAVVVAVEEAILVAKGLSRVSVGRTLLLETVEGELIGRVRCQMIEESTGVSWTSVRRGVAMANLIMLQLR